MARCRYLGSAAQLDLRSLLHRIFPPLSHHYLYRALVLALHFDELNQVASHRVLVYLRVCEKCSEQAIYQGNRYIIEEAILYLLSPFSPLSPLSPSFG